MVQTRPSQCANKVVPASQIPPAQSSLSMTKDSLVELNWILFDKSRRAPVVISIPRNLYDGPSQYCQPLFLTELSLRYKVATEAHDIRFWTTKEPLLIKDAAGKGWATSINDLEDSFNPVKCPETFSDSVVVVDRRHVHLVITIEDEGSASGQTIINAVPELKEFKRYDKTVLTPGITPSEGAKSTGYRIGPPIQIFHPIFDHFIHLVNDPNVQPTVNDLKIVQELMCFASEVGRIEDWHNGHDEGLRKRLRHILQAEVHEEPNSDGTEPDDGVITIQIGDVRIAFLILELKRELGEGGCDPTTQSEFSMKRSWIDPTRRAVREKCCCPTFLVAGGGPWLSILGGVFTDKFIVQRLTDMRWMALSSTEEDSRVYHNARILIALRQSLVKLQGFYLGLHDVPPFVANKPHPRYFPYPTSYITEDGRLTRFRYLASLEEDAACVTYLAEVVNETGATVDPANVVVKFVARYSKGVHEFLARKDYAPILRYCGPLPKTELSGIFPGPAQCAPPGLCLRSELMHMVVMDYVHPSRPNPPPDVRKQIETVLTALHSEGYVFGDLRKQNILFDAHGKVKFFDFNWCGRYDMNICDATIPNDLQDHIGKNANRDQVKVGPYAHYPLSMSTLEGMWAPGMEPLAQIRPQHDWMMLEKLSW